MIDHCIGFGFQVVTLKVVNHTMATVASSSSEGLPATTKSSCSSNAGATGSENPVPSITLSITQDDVKRVLEASEALSEKLAQMQQQEDSGTDESSDIVTVDGDSTNRTGTGSRGPIEGKETTDAVERPQSDEPQALQQDAFQGSSLRSRPNLDCILAGPESI